MTTPPVVCGKNGCVQPLSMKASTDPDEGWCLWHGTVFIGVVLGHPNESSIYQCPDCGTGVYREGTRCKPCRNKAQGLAMRGDPRLSTRGQRIVLTPSYEFGPIGKVNN